MDSQTKITSKQAARDYLNSYFPRKDIYERGTFEPIDLLLTNFEMEQAWSLFDSLEEPHRSERLQNFVRIIPFLDSEWTKFGSKEAIDGVKDVLERAREHSNSLMHTLRDASADVAFDYQDFATIESQLTLIRDYASLKLEALDLSLSEFNKRGSGDLLRAVHAMRELGNFGGATQFGKIGTDQSYSIFLRRRVHGLFQEYFGAPHYKHVATVVNILLQNHDPEAPLVDANDVIKATKDLRGS